MLVAAPLGLGARPRDGALPELDPRAASRGCPSAIDFFLFQPRAAWTALGLLVALPASLAGVYPSWRGASLPIAAHAARGGGGMSAPAESGAAPIVAVTTWCATTTWASEVVHAVRGVSLHGRARRVRRDRRPVGVRQVHAAQPARRHRPADVGHRVPSAATRRGPDARRATRRASGCGASASSSSASTSCRRSRRARTSSCRWPRRG